MSTHYQITHEGNQVVVRLKGVENIDVAERLWPGVVEACEEHKCFNVLGIADTTEPLSAADSFNHAELFRKLNIDHRYRIAWVELNSDAHEATSFAELVLSNRGLPGRLFADVQDAKEWLRKNSVS